MHIKRLIFMVLTVGILLVTWLVLPFQYRFSSITSYFTPVFADWQGVITIWQLSGWRTAKGTKGTQLAAVVKQFERKYRGVFIEIEDMDTEELTRRLAGGELPDILSYPGGISIPAEMQCIDLHEFYSGIMTEFRQAAERQDGIYAVPWCYEPCRLMVNLEMAGKKKVTWPENVTLLSQLTDLAAQSSKDKKSGLAISAADNNRFGLACADGALPKGSLANSQTAWEAWESFYTGQAAVLVCGGWEQGAMERRIESNKGFSYQIMDFPGDCAAPVNVQWLSVSAGMEQGKQDHCLLFLSMLLEKERQVKIANDLAVLSPRTDVAILPDWLMEAPDWRDGRYCIIRPGMGADSADLLAAALGDAAAKDKVRANCLIR